jgi:hypothetical protein
MIQGALKSKTVWLNVALAVLSGVELAGSHLTTLFGAKVAAGILLAGSLSNIVLRTVTTQALAQK